MRWKLVYGLLPLAVFAGALIAAGSVLADGGTTTTVVTTTTATAPKYPTVTMTVRTYIGRNAAQKPGPGWLNSSEWIKPVPALVTVISGGRPIWKTLMIPSTEGGAPTKEHQIIRVRGGSVLRSYRRSSGTVVFVLPVKSSFLCAYWKGVTLCEIDKLLPLGPYEPPVGSHISVFTFAG